MRLETTTSNEEVGNDIPYPDSPEPNIYGGVFLAGVVVGVILFGLIYLIIK